MEFAYINGEVLRWARERRGLSRGLLATQFGVSLDRLAEWESGTDFPPFGKAQDLANALKVPFGYFFLSTPPVLAPPLPDLRTVAGERKPPSPEFIDLLNDVMVKHDWYKDYVAQTETRRLPFVGKFRLPQQLLPVVSDVRNVIVPNEARNNSTSVSDYLRLLTERAENAKILVMRGGVVRGNPRRSLSVAEFRGFAISDSVAPLIFINSKDAHAAQVFTLAHELIHLWVGQSGISNSDPSSPGGDDSQAETETFCNRAAAELLVPSEEFALAWQAMSGDSESKVESLVRRFKVSFPMILRRALEHGKIPRRSFFTMLHSHQERVQEIELRQEEQEDSSGGGNFYNTFFARNSRRFTLTVTSAVRSGALTSLEAARLLGVRTSTIPRLAERILP